jgi:hypothetical protein
VAFAHLHGGSDNNRYAFLLDGLKSSPIAIPFDVEGQIRIWLDRERFGASQMKRGGLPGGPIEFLYERLKFRPDLQVVEIRV